MNKRIKTLNSMIKVLKGSEATIDTLETIIKGSNAKLMTISFVKKDNTIRTMYCKVGVKKHLSKNPNKRKSTLKSTNTIRVYDVENNGYRSFNLDSVIDAKVGNVVWSV